MKQIAVILAALLSLALVAPALAQPFADVPTDHWAYDAIAELAAKGLIEGYPDGAFRGDRAMTRYEMAMVVARLLARIEAIKIPPLPPDLVRQADLAKAQAADAAAIKALDTRLTTKLATVQRLVAEFRAELAALGVRVTAVEEELAAIRARLDNTRITGSYRTRYNFFPQGSVSGGGTNRNPDVRIRAIVQFTGRAGPNVEAVVRMFAANNQGTLTADTRYGNNFFGGVTFDLAYLDVTNVWYAKLWRVGRQFYTLNSLNQFGLGLLYDPANYGQFSAGLSDGIRGDFAFGPLDLTLAVFRDSVVSGASLSGLGGAPIKDYRIVSAKTGAFIPGWTLGASYYEEWQHPGSPVPTSGGRGWEVLVSGNLLPGLSLYGNYASWTSIPAVGASELGSSNAWRIGGNINLGQLAGISQWNPNIDFAYQSYGPVASGCPVPPSGAGGTGFPGGYQHCFPSMSYAATIINGFYIWNMKGWMAQLNLTFNPRTTGFLLYEWGDVQSGIPAGASSRYDALRVGFQHTLAPRTNLLFEYRKEKGPGTAATPTVDTVDQYRASLLYSW